MTSSRCGAICACALVAVVLSFTPDQAAAQDPDLPDAQAGDLPALLLTTAPDAASADGSAAEPPFDTVLSLLDGPSDGPDVGAVLGTAPVTAARPSPDGRWIAWIGAAPTAEHTPAETGPVWLHDLQTGTSWTIAVSALAHDGGLAWDDGSQTIGVTTADGAVLIDVATGDATLHPLTEPGDRLLDVHGDRVVVSRGNMGWVLTPGQAPRQLDDPRSVRSAQFSPDGSRIAVVIHITSTGFGFSGLYIDGPDGMVHEYSAPFDLGENFRPRIGDIAWTPDGTGIVLVDHSRQLHHRVPDGGDGPGDLVVADGARLLLGWSDDGDHLVYANGRTPVGGSEVLATRLDGSHTVLLATVPDLVDAAAVPRRPFAATPTGDTVADALHWSALLDPESQPVRTVILTRSDDFADALASGVLQGALQAPLLLTDTHVLSHRVTAELFRLAPDEVIILGGEAAVSATVAQELVAQGYAVQRIAGATRIDTAVALASATAPDADTVLLARAFGTDGDPSQAFADALGAGAASATHGQPLLLTDSAGLSATTAAHLRTSGVQRVRIIGGTAAVSAAVEADLGDLGLDVQRIAGDSRHATAAALAGAHRDDDGRGASAVIEGTTPDSWAEGLAAALHVRVVGGDGVFLTAGDVLPDATVEGLGAATGADGPPLRCGRSVPADTCDAARAAYTS